LEDGEARVFEKIRIGRREFAEKEDRSSGRLDDLRIAAVRAKTGGSL
jgi:hypothetical protein